MNNQLKNKIIEISYALLPKACSDQKHFSFITRRNKIISIGINSKYKSHPYMQKNGFKYNKIHSEIASILKFPYPINEINKYTLINVRINKDNILAISRPCKYCIKVLVDIGIKKIYFTDTLGIFQEL